MSGLRAVVGVGLDGSTVTVTIGKLEIRCIKASYGDKLEKGTLTEMGSQEIAEITRGTYSTEDLKITMSEVRYRTEYMPAALKNGFGNASIPIVIGRLHPDLGDDSDLIEGCQQTGATVSPENSNKPAEAELTFKPRQVKWTHERKTLNELRGVVPDGLQGF